LSSRRWPHAVRVFVVGGAGAARASYHATGSGSFPRASASRAFRVANVATAARTSARKTSGGFGRIYRLA
jgi:hypothetical protein